MKKDCSALILAAGISSRMKQPKLLLTTPEGTTFLENIARQYDEFGCQRIIIVLNVEGVNLINKHQIKLPSQTQIILNLHPEFGRFYSIKTGIIQIESSYTFIHNVDNPFAKLEVLEQLYISKKEADVIKPVYNGIGGHPVLISQKVCDSILVEDENTLNLKAILSRFITLKIEVHDATILQNINTYNEYLELYRK